MVMELRDVMRKLPPDGNARHAFRQFNLNPNVNGKARSVKRLAEELGFDVMIVSMPPGHNGRLVQDTFSDNGYRIEISASIRREAQRFAVLHEIGHYFLHTEPEDPFEDSFNFDPSMETFYVDLQQEREANEFAEAVLFGPDSLRATMSLFGGDREKVRLYYGVTRAVLENALRNFRVA